MSEKPLPPPPPDHLPEAPEFPRQSRYQRPRKYVSWWGILFGLMIGLGGGLYWAWEIDPIIDLNIAPHQLTDENKARYVIAIMMRYNYDSDLGQVVEGLTELQLGGDPIDGVADIACDLARSGYVDSSSGIRAVRNLQTFYQLQGRESCADVLIPEVDEAAIVEIEVPTATPTIAPPPSKTPTPITNIRPTATENVVIVPTTPPQRLFEGRISGTFCDVELSGIIEVFVVTYNGDGIPGEAIRVRWDTGEDTFLSGLLPERGTSYADFEMEAGKGYTIDMPGLSDPISTPLVADNCTTEDGVEAITSYRVLFRQIG